MKVGMLLNKEIEPNFIEEKNANCYAIINTLSIYIYIYIYISYTVT